MTSSRKRKKKLYKLLHPLRSYEILLKQHDRNFRKFKAGHARSIKSIKRKENAK